MSDMDTKEQHYRVKQALAGPAIVRIAPRKNAAVVKGLHAGDDWYGLPEEGQLVTITGLGSSTVWICNESMFCVSLVFLEQAD